MSDQQPPAADAAAELEQRLLGGPRVLRRREVAAAAGVSLLSARRFWRALGFPNVADAEQAFTKPDLQALRGVVALVRDGVVDDDTALGLTRSIGRHADRLASWQVQLLADEVARSDPAGDDDPATAARRTGELLDQVADRTAPLLVYAWRRHLASTLARLVTDAAGDASGDGPDGAAATGGSRRDRPATVRTVGFADLVAFTAAVRRMPERQLATLVQRFEALTSDIVSAHGGRVVKTVGDEVLFLAVTPAAAAGIALDIAEALAADPGLPDVRVGVASGPVLARLGDVYGDTVNRASRLTGVAVPGTVLADGATARRLAEGSGFALQRRPVQWLPGLGPLTPWALARSSRRGPGHGPAVPPGHVPGPPGALPQRPGPGYPAGPGDGAARGMPGAPRDSTGTGTGGADG